MIANILRNPWTGIIGSISSIIALFLAVLFYYSAQKTPEISYYVHPVRATVAAPSASSKLKIIYDNSEVSEKVYASQIAVWNRGTQSVSAPRKAWRIWSGESPGMERVNHPPLSSVAPLAERCIG